MSKPIEYYLAIDLAQAAKEIARAGRSRGDLDAFHDAINAIYFRIKSKSLSEAELHAALGSPDRVASIPGEGQAHTYTWAQNVNGVKVASQTSFLVEDGLVTGLKKDE